MFRVNRNFSVKSGGSDKFSSERGKIATKRSTVQILSSFLRQNCFLIALQKSDLRGVHHLTQRNVYQHEGQLNIWIQIFPFSKAGFG